MTPLFWLWFVAVLVILACEWGALTAIEGWWHRVRGRRAAQREMAAQAMESEVQ